MAAWFPQNISPDLICVVCEEQFRSPVMMICGHTFCRECLDERHLQAPGPDLVCPICGKRTRLGKNGTKGLPVNHAYMRLLSRRGVVSNLPCLVCEEIPPRSAVKSCLQCKLSYCGPCLEMLHPNRGSFMQHELVPPRLSLSPPQEDLCESHKEKLALYCNDCQKPTCLVCERVGIHKNHQVLDITTAYQHAQVEMRGKFNYLQSRVSKSRDDLKRMETVFDTQKRVLEQFHERVTHAYDGLMDVIADRKAAVLHKSAKKLEGLTGHTVRNCLALRNSLEDNELCVALLAESFAETDKLRFLKAAPSLKIRLDTALRLSHQTEKHTSHYSVRTEDACADIIQRGYYTVTIADCGKKDNTITFKVNNGRLANPTCGIQ